MNNVKRELMEVAGDLTESKKRVINGVEQKLQVPRNKKAKFMPAMAAAVVLLIVGLFVVQFMQEQSSQAFKDEEIIDFYEAQLEGVGFNPETAKESAIDNFVFDKQLLAFGQSYDIQVTDAQKKEAATTHLTSFFEEMRIKLEEVLQEKGYTMQDYEHFVQEYLGMVSSTKQQLTDQFAKNYPGFSDAALNDLVSLEVMSFFERSYPEELAQLNKLYNYQLFTPFGELKKGVIVAVDDQALLYAPGFTGAYKEEDRALLEGESDQLVWIPKRPDWDVAVGDRVKTNIYTTFTHSEPMHVYNPEAVALNMTVLTDEVVQFKISSTAAMDQWHKTIDWTIEEMEMTTEPSYRFHVGADSYDGWLTPDKAWLELYNPTTHQYGKVRIAKLAMWMEMISP